MQHFSLHTHTQGFDGQNTVLEMTQQAQHIGFTKLGISNHFIVHPNVKKSVMYRYAQRGGYAAIYSENFNEAIVKFQNHYAQIDAVQEETGFSLLKGMEVDFFDTPEWHKGFERALKILKPDYVIGSAHFVTQGEELLNTHDVAKTKGAEQDALLRQYWENVRKAAQSGYFDLMAHLDLLKKKDLGVADKWIDQEMQTVETLHSCGQTAEINTSALDYKSDPFPEMRMLKMLAEKGVPVILSDDAHKAEQLGWYYGTAFRIAQKAGLQLAFQGEKTTDTLLHRAYLSRLADKER